MANLYVYLLPAILHAVFSCVPRPRPTPKPPGATGEEPPTTATTETTTTTVEACSGTPDNSTVTEDGKSCVFPFKDGDVQHTSCVEHQGKYNWCATSLKPDCSYETWSKCLETTSKPEVKCLTEEVNSGKPCLFPFKYEGKESMECLPYKGKYWCGLTYEYDKQRWGYCTQALCPPTKGGTTGDTTTATTTTTTTTTTATTITTTTTTTTTTVEWEMGQTALDIENTEKSLTCKVSFEFEIEKGIHTRNTLSACSASESLEDAIPTFGNQTFQLTSGSGLSFSCSLVAILLEDNLSEEVLEKTLKCQVNNDQCLAVDGEIFPSKCRIPFIKNGRKYKGCTDTGSPDRLWCPTEVDAEGLLAIEGKWGYCNDRCGYCAGSDVQARKDTATSCGYDCYVNLAKEMEPKTAGTDPKLLSPPTLTYKIKTLTAWNKLPNNHFQFKKAQPGLFLTCKNGFNHFACHQDIYINCTGNYLFSAYRATIVDTTYNIREKIAVDVPNTHLGCDTCPRGFEYKEGYQSRTYQTSLGGYDNVPDEVECKKKCESLRCETFAFSPTSQVCKLHANKVTSPSNPKYKDYKMCVKVEAEACLPPLQEPTLNCKGTKNTRIVQGVTADPTLHPWMACLSYQDLNARQCGCGGALISKKVVLTAAHCEYDVALNGGPLIFFGVHDASDIANANTIMQKNIQSSGISKQHPQHIPAQYRPPILNANGDPITKGNLAEDIMLIILDTEITLTPTIKVINLPDDTFARYNILATVYGWGLKSYCYSTVGGGIDYADELQEVVLEILDKSSCHSLMDTQSVKDWYDAYLKMYDVVDRNDNTNGFAVGWKFCAQSPKNPYGAGCYGDSGSPLVYRDNRGVDYVVGVLSHGMDCLSAFLKPPVNKPNTQNLPKCTVFSDVRYYAKMLDVQYLLA